MKQQEFISAVMRNPANKKILERLPSLGLNDAWLVSGSIFQTVWNILTDRPIDHGIKDYDVFYFDPDTRWESEDAVIKRCAELFSDLDVEVEVRNQARVPLWFEKKFGLYYPPIKNACEAIDRFLATACMIGLSPREEGPPVLYAPEGLRDLLAMHIRPNPSAIFSATHYNEKIRLWRLRWPEITAAPPLGPGDETQ